MPSPGSREWNIVFQTREEDCRVNQSPPFCCMCLVSGGRKRSQKDKPHAITMTSQKSLNKTKEGKYSCLGRVRPENKGCVDNLSFRTSVEREKMEAGLRIDFVFSPQSVIFDFKKCSHTANQLWSLYRHMSHFAIWSISNQGLLLICKQVIKNIHLGFLKDNFKFKHRNWR